MRSFWAIVGGATLLFMAVAMVQEWKTFAAVFSPEPSGKPALSDAERAGVEMAVRSYLGVSNHLYASAGDPRYVDRLAASDPVKGALLDEIAYLRRNHRLQVATLHEMTVAAVEPLSPDRATVETKEFWSVRTLLLDGTTESDPSQSSVVRVRYGLARRAGDWQVEAWDILPDLRDEDPTVEPQPDTRKGE